MKYFKKICIIMSNGINKALDKNIKVILLGESGVGKTSIIFKYVKDHFTERMTPTIGSTYMQKDIIRDNITYKLNIWDTSGQERYHSVTKLFIQKADIVILVYSIDDKQSLKNIDYWYNEVTDMLGNKFVLSIVGNKYDLFDDDEIDAIPQEEGEKIAKEKNAIFKLISAKEDKKGIDTLFEQLLDEYLNKIDKNERLSHSFLANNINIDIEKPRKKCC